MAERAYRRLNDPQDTYMNQVLDWIFKIPRNAAPRNVNHIKCRNFVEKRLQSLTPLSAVLNGLRTIREVQVRTDADIRYYCDNDLHDIGFDPSPSRWTLRPDPPNGAPLGYKRQSERPRLPQRNGEQYQEWEDRDNEIVMARNLGCQTPPYTSQGVTWLDARGGAPREWSTATVRRPVISS
ncbi:MAG: hypothetical protein Q9227_001015 [Pyrenula ochraceoflavens]